MSALPLPTIGDLAEFRALAESRMTSRTTIYRSTGLTAQDESTGRERAEYAATEDVPCRIKGASAAGASTSQTVRVGGTEAERETATASLPHDQDLADGDWLVVTAGEWVGSVWRVVDASKGDQQTARRVRVVEDTPPADGWV